MPILELINNPIISHLIKSFKYVNDWLMDAAALASNPEVGSSMKSMEGLATNSTAIVSLLHCSVERPFTPGNPTNACLNGFSSTSSITSSTNTCNHFSFLKNSRTSW
ncbi:hypothetical protein RGQ29_020880 [Quercus rubra]|uniref:Uncharacterized protein n=1 Tax=Quercus rubra TaxID=3512 RepID=A0AAN7FBY8_QUERU|nr:hypothetical protein RGQ29_020880 [Quercus rubra]